MSDRSPSLGYSDFSNEVAARKWKPGTVPRKPRSALEILDMMVEDLGIELEELKTLYRDYASHAQQDGDISWLPAIDDVGFPKPDNEASAPLSEIKLDSFSPKMGSQRPTVGNAHSANARKRSLSSSSPSKILLSQMEMEGFNALWNQAIRLENGSGAVAGPVSVVKSLGLTQTQANNLWTRLKSLGAARTLSRSESKIMANRISIVLPSFLSVIGILVPKEQVEIKASRSGSSKEVKQTRQTGLVEPKPRGIQTRAATEPKQEIEQLRQGLRALTELIVVTNRGTIQTALALLKLKDMDLLPPDIEAALLEKPRP